MKRMQHVAAVVSVCCLCLLSSRADAGVMVTIGNPGNQADASGFGAVDYVYSISATEVTNSEFVLFLNAIAATDTYGVYHPNMAGYIGGITRSGNSGSYTYEAVSGREDNPVVYVSFYTVLRYVNWLENGRPTGEQGAQTTEDGTYTITTAGILAGTITRNADATWILPNEDEWYKAAYYDPGTDSYYRYATSSNIVPIPQAPPGGTNSANYSRAVDNTTPVGAYSLSVSPYGTFDQAGNVSEWNDDNFGGSARIVRGGSLAFNQDVISSDFRVGIQAHDPDPTIGFRVANLSPQNAVVPEPGSMSLTVTGLLGLGVFYRARTMRRIRKYPPIVSAV